jgi:hypothetical protein
MRGAVAQGDGNDLVDHAGTIKGVMAGLVPAISLIGGVPKRDARVKPAHDSGEAYSPASSFMMR